MSHAILFLLRVAPLILPLTSAVQELFSTNDLYTLLLRSTQFIGKIIQQGNHFLLTYKLITTEPMVC